MDGRDDKGRFVPGHGCRGGRPRKSDEQAVVAALQKELPLAEWARLVAQCSQNPKHQGWALKLYAEYAIGLPAQRLQLSGPEDGPIEIDTYNAYEQAVAEATGTEV